MPSHFCLSVRFLGSAFHGESDGGEREWPPSPLRVFQALVAAAARRNAGELSEGAQFALKWLEAREQPPLVIAPVAIEGSSYHLSVPNNAMDIVARAWVRGSDSSSGDANPATHRSMKPVHPTLLCNSDSVQYLWGISYPLTTDARSHLQFLSETARSIVALGWGSDLAVGHGMVLTEEQADELPGERWMPGQRASEYGLRVPIRGTLDDLMNHHKHFLNRLSADGFIPPPPLTTYENVEYKRAIEPRRRPIAAFSLLRPDASGFRAFDTARRGLTVTGMLRNAVKIAAGQSGWAESKIATFVLGHGESHPGERHVAVGTRRFAYLPLPTMESRNNGHAPVAGSIRRVMLSGIAGECEDEIAWAKRMMSSQELIDAAAKTPVAVLSLIPASDNVVQRYTRRAETWATVTPVVLPGYDDPRHYRLRMQRKIGAEEQRRLLQHLDERVDVLLRKAIAHAGFSKLLADNADLQVREVGFWQGTEPAERYGVPDHLKRFPRYHVKIRWRNLNGNSVEIPGPICLGGGRFYGLGLFAAM
jgi:CRISPR-associated protein Csb2